MMQEILSAFGFSENAASPFGDGLINDTWLVQANNENYILQRINHNVFKKPFAIAKNIQAISDYLKKKDPDYLFVTPLLTIHGNAIYHDEKTGNHYRIFPFVKNSHTINVAQQPLQAQEAAAQFGKFTYLLKDFDAGTLEITLPDFHNLPLRYEQFANAIQNGNKKRIAKAVEEINFLQKQVSIVSIYKSLANSAQFRQRVTHHDTKISNVLLGENDKGLCVIDLDTMMPGYFISDVGDMIRTCGCTVSEEETDLTKIDINEDYVIAIAKGYLQYMNSELTPEEKDHFIYAGKFMIYMQALRFLTDYLNDDVYYGQRYEGHNLARAQNQITLLQQLIKKEKLLTDIIKNIA